MKPLLITWLLACGLMGIILGCTSLEANLLLATSNGEITGVKTLLAQGADINARDKELGTTALIIATRNGFTNIVGLLLDQGAAVDITDVDPGLTALMYASRDGNIEITRILLDKGADVHFVSQYGATALGIAIVNGNRTIVKELKKAGARE